MTTPWPRTTLFFAFGVLLGLGWQSSAQAGPVSGKAYEDAGDTTHKIRVWIPGSATSVRGMCILGNPFDSTSLADADNPAYRAWATIQRFALVGTVGFGRAIASGEGDLFLKAVAGVAIKSGHSELNTCPWVAAGMSNGGQMAWGFNAWNPGRTIAFVVNKGGYYKDPEPAAAALATPGILIAGAKDTPLRRDNIRSLFVKNRAKGALFSWVEEEGIGHELGDSDDLFLLFFDEAIKTRFPPHGTMSPSVTSEESGWLTDQTTGLSAGTKIYPHAQYSGIVNQAGWLLNETTARYYQAFSTYAHQVTIVEPTAGAVYQAPVSVRVKITNTVASYAKTVLYNGSTFIAESAANPAEFVVPLSKASVNGFLAIAKTTANVEYPSKLAPVYIVEENDYQDLGSGGVDSSALSDAGLDASMPPDAAVHWDGNADGLGAFDHETSEDAEDSNAGDSPTIVTQGLGEESFGCSLCGSKTRRRAGQISGWILVAMIWLVRSSHAKNRLRSPRRGLRRLQAPSTDNNE